jgi:putative inorganic carbon (HCO3(-)) transporter
MSGRNRSMGMILAIASLGACLFALLLLKSEVIGFASYAVGIGLVILLLEPFTGLVNYLVLLYLRPQEFVPALESLPLMLLVGSATFGIMIFHFILIRRKIPVTPAPQNVLMVLLLGAIVLSHLSHLFLHGALHSAREFLSTLVMYFLIVALVNTETKMRITLYLLTMLTLVLAIQGIVQFYTGFGLAQQTMIVGRIRSIGIFADPNDLALTFLMVMPFMFFTLLDSRAILVKLQSIAILAMLGYAFYLTGSRGGFLGLAVLAFLLFVRRFGLRLGSIVGVVSVILLFAVSPERFGNLSPQEASAYGRIEAWGRGLSLLKANPLFGTGAGTFMNFHYRTAHNSFVLCASELGLAGLFVWVLLIFISMKNLFFIGTEARGRGLISIALLSDSLFFAFVGYLTAGFFLSRTYNELLYIMIGLTVAVTSIFADRTGERYKLMERKDLLYAAFILAGTLLFLKLVTLFYW